MENLRNRGQKLDADAFRRACGCYPTGICVATFLNAQGEPQGLTINSFSSVSLHPPIVSLCVDHRASVAEEFRQSSAFAINVLAEDQMEISVRFSRSAGDRYEATAWEPGVLGAPVLHGVLAVLECEVVQRIAAGDHDIVLGEAKIAHSREGRPLLYYKGGYNVLAE